MRRGMTLGEKGAGLRRIVAGEHFEFASKGSALEDVEERFGGGKAGSLFAHDEVVSRAMEGDEVETEGLRGGTGGDAGVGIAGDDAVGRGEVSIGDAIVAIYFGCGNGGLLEQLVEKGPAAGTAFAIDETNAAMSKVLWLPNTFGISRSDDQAFFPAGEGNDVEVVIGEHFANKRQVEFAGLGIFEVRSRDVDFAFLQPGEGKLAGSGGRYDFDSADPFDHVRQQA